MADILQKIVATKKIEVAHAKKLVSIDVLDKLVAKNKSSPQSLVKNLRTQPGIIAEFKRASPSKGIINPSVQPKNIIKGYDAHGAVGISVLTDKSYFQAKDNDFYKARLTTSKPLLRKEFIIDEYQIYQSKAMGADVVLLIAAILSKTQIAAFTKVAHKLKLEVLIELHACDEINKLSGEEDIIGVNNRNLKTFKVDINQSILIKKQLGKTEAPLISESGLSNIIEVEKLLAEGFQGFLMGEHFMKQKDPINAFKEFNNQLQNLSQ